MSKIKYIGSLYCLITLGIQIQKPCTHLISRLVFWIHQYTLIATIKERENIPKRFYPLPPYKTRRLFPFFCLLCMWGSVSGIGNWIKRAPGRSVGTVTVHETRETNTHRMEFQVRKCIRRQQRNSEVKTQARSSQRGIRTTDVLFFHVSLFCLFFFNYFSFVLSFLFEKQSALSSFLSV